MKFSKLLSTSIAVGAMLFTASSSAVYITASSGAASITINDNGIGDVDLDLGIIVQTASLGGWEVEVGTAITKPLIAAPTLIQLTTSGFDAFGGAAADLRIETAELGFTDLGSLSGYNSMTTVSTLDDGITSQLFISLLNDGSDWLELSNVTSTDASNHEDLANLISPAAPFGLMLVHTYKGGAESVSGGTTSSATIPEPSIVALFGLGLVGMGIASRRKQKTVA